MAEENEKKELTLEDQIQEMAELAMSKWKEAVAKGDTKNAVIYLNAFNSAMSKLKEIDENNREYYKIDAEVQLKNDMNQRDNQTKKDIAEYDRIAHSEELVAELDSKEKIASEELKVKEKIAADELELKKQQAEIENRLAIINMICNCTINATKNAGDLMLGAYKTNRMFTTNCVQMAWESSGYNPNNSKASRAMISSAEKYMNIK